MRLFIITLFILFSSKIFGQTLQVSTSETQWPIYEVSGDISTNLLNIHISGSFDRSFHPRPGFHWSLGGGAFIGPVVPTSGFGHYADGFFISSSLWTGKKHNHFEMKIGLAGYNLRNKFRPSFFPIVYFGYRRQKKNNPYFFRTYLGTVGIGFGVGRVWGRN